MLLSKVFLKRPEVSEMPERGEKIKSFTVLLALLSKYGLVMWLPFG
jgi:hypothetical protein